VALANVGGSNRTIPFYVREANHGSFSPTKPYTGEFQIEVSTLEDVLRGRDAHRILITLDIEGMEIETLESYIPSEARAVRIAGELHGHKENSRLLENIFSDKQWELRFEDVSDRGSLFEAHSPAALASLGRGHIPSQGRSPTCIDKTGMDGEAPCK
jgi:hypothetical protein